MTIRGTENITMRDSMGLNVDKRCKGVWCAEEAKRYPSAVDFAEVKGIPLFTVYGTLNGQQKTCRGLHISYEENVRETQQMLANQIAIMNSERSEIDEMKKKAALWDAYQKEQEAARKAKGKHDAEVAKARGKIENLKEKERLAQERYQLAIARRQEAERKLSTLLEGGKANV